MRGMRLGPKGQGLMMAVLLAVAVARVFGGSASHALPHVYGLHGAGQVHSLPVGN